MIKALHSYYLKQLFKPGLISLFINPFYFIRLHLYIAVKKQAVNCTGRILDLGCGLKPYKQLFTNAGEYIGIDIENPGHDHSKEEIDVYYDGKTIPFEDNSFDCVFFSEVFEHVFNPDEILKEVFRVLKPNGKVLLTTPFAWDEHEIPYDYCRYTSFGIKHILEKNNFTISDYSKTGHFIQVIVQYWMLYIRNNLFTKNKYLNIFINLIFISPFTITGILFSAILPRKQSLYFNNIVVAVK
jgi:SAM-dependent methyltransferase